MTTQAFAHGFYLQAQAHFDAAHHLPLYKGACHNMHGHRWTVQARWFTKVLEDGLAFDLKILKQRVKTIADLLDHKVLNETIPNPTAEHLCVWFIEQLRAFPEGKYLVCVSIFETPDTKVSVQCQ